MGVSDTLFEAGEEIRNYLKNGQYEGSLGKRIELLLAQMDEMRAELDAGPALSEHYTVINDRVCKVLAIEVVDAEELMGGCHYVAVDGSVFEMCEGHVGIHQEPVFGTAESAAHVTPSLD